ncbi:MAG: hypothetical protein QGI83_12520, partial [Candidatus Latescibacteria bacterium]|nr:hypothetical protein [Candidatus Latescibacterota bacterium]
IGTEHLHKSRSNNPGINQPNSPPLHRDLLCVPGGADVTRRYQDGVLTDKPLWPWPMNQRIIDAMRLAGYDDPVDVTRTIFDLTGRPM